MDETRGGVGVGVGELQEFELDRLVARLGGGPVVDLDGNVVGINIARAGRVETLALPRETVLAAVERILATSDK